MFSECTQRVGRYRQYNCIYRQTTALNSMENAYMKLADMECRLKKERENLTRTVDETLKETALLNDEELETID